MMEIQFDWSWQSIWILLKASIHLAAGFALLTVAAEVIVDQVIKGLETYSQLGGEQ